MEKNEVLIKVRKSKLKEDSAKLAKHIASKHKITPYNEDELTDVICAGLRAGEIVFYGENALNNAEKWFKERLMPNTIILTEEDVRTYLYHLLLGDFGELEETADGGKSIPLHSEIRWLGSSGKLKLRSDIVLFDVSSLRTKNRAEIQIHAKGYGFGRPYILIETKLRRNKRGANKGFTQKILKDRERIKKIKSEIPHDFYSYIIALDKKKPIGFQTEDLEFHKEFYVCLNESN